VRGEGRNVLAYSETQCCFVANAITKESNPPKNSLAEVSSLELRINDASVTDRSDPLEIA
jgi:hypothetical protein